MAQPAPPEVIDPEVTSIATPSEYVVRSTTLDLVRGLPSFSIRNGDPSDVVPFVIRPTIAKGFRWTPVQGLPPAKAIEKVDLFIKSSIAQLTLHPPEGYDAAKIRKAGIVLGTTRAVTTNMYDVSPADLIPGESRGSLFHYSRTEAGVEAVRVAAAAPQAVREMLMEDFVPSDVERSAMSILLTSGLGVAPLQGFSIIMTGHHYLSEGSNASRKAFAVLEKQVWKGSAYTDWFTNDLTDIRDLAWHKACHPIRINLKEQWASDPMIAAALRSSGVGAAASRLPAAEPEVRAAQSFATLMQTVRPYFQTTGGVVDYGALLTAIDTVALFPALYTNVAGAQPAAAVLPPGVPNTVNNRQSAIAYLDLVMSRNKDAVATAYGFYVTLSERSSSMGGEMVVDTLKNSFALRKLRTQSIAAYNMGVEFYGDYTAAKAAMRGRGEYETPNISFQS